MRKFYSLILAFLLTCLIFISIHYLLKEGNERQTIIVTRIIDGDTLELEDGSKARLLNINSPEKDMSGYLDSIRFLKQFENSALEFEFVGVDKYGRNLARVYSKDYINLKMVNLGLASKFLVQDSEAKIFDRAEKNAVEGSIGMWKKSEEWGCIEVKIEPKNEVLELLNKCHKLNLEGWYIKDESRKVYKFPNISIGVVRLHSGNGKDNSSDLYWGSKTNIWNDDRDTVYLFDKNNKISFHYSYGY